ncbi:hypothetical protein SPI_08952 [Niveomyces insectorum RCEF 264]|uniref:Uncharacterized protein n=1 Tax=Niveomyces insectorum RCEF 264 TaxID=1081102 RepID=A0A167MGR3_9HYPO|nr:hypothetical protein SPI_08952 [Niveomyces insectorum RCEF 264]
MTSTATEAPSSLRHDGQLAVRLSSAQPQATALPPAASSASEQQATQWAARRRPQKPAIPKHPIPTMQEAFAESLAEVTSGTLAMKPKLRVDNAQIRRDRLLDQEKSEGPPAALWRLRPGQNCHELRKLLAQIAFGVYLLLKGMANSNAQVVAILQSHIDEVDDFLKTAMEDLKLATQDLNTRLDYLKLPLGNLPAFEEMLEDREFRLRIVDGNVRIEHILSRTSTALDQTTHDVSEGMRSTREFTAYLAAEENGPWRVERPDVIDIYEAMRGNAEGWLNAFVDLEEKANMLDLLISKLADMVTAMDRCAGEVSRRTRFSIKPFTLPEITGRPSHESHESHESYLSSHDTTPALSPGLPVPQMPPRLSLRFSALGDSLAPNFLENPSSRNSTASRQSLPTFAYTAPAELSVTSEKAEQPTETANTLVTPNAEQPAVQTTEAKAGAASEFANENDLRLLDTAVSVDRIDIKADSDVFTQTHNDNGSVPVPQPADDVTSIDGQVQQENTEAPKEIGLLEDKPDEEETLFILQPRTYTPQLPTPLPSPRLQDSDGDGSERRSGDVEAISPRSYIPPVEERLSYQPPLSPDARASRPPLQQAPQQAPQQRRTMASRLQDEDRVATERQSSIVSSLSVSSGRTVEGDNSSGPPRKRTSIRDRVSLRTTPPDAILVPPPNASQLRRPVFASPRTYQNYRTFTGPDSAYSSDADRTTSVVITEPPPTNVSGHSRDFSPPVIPNVIPSPHSDQQYFRPVQASPHSPLQQRPHTAGQVPSRPYHLRNAPSSMGMSMLSSVTTMTQNSKGQPTLKKKRSAFGWLKKAFTLDEDERATFDHRRQIEERNLYYDARSPRFLDGKRIR